MATGTTDGCGRPRIIVGVHCVIVSSTMLVLHLHGHPPSTSTGDQSSSYASRRPLEDPPRRLFTPDRSAAKERPTAFRAPAQRQRSFESRKGSNTDTTYNVQPLTRLEEYTRNRLGQITAPVPMPADASALPSVESYLISAALDFVIATARNAAIDAVVPPLNIGSLILFRDTVLAHQRDSAPVELLIASLSAQCKQQSLSCEVNGVGRHDGAQHKAAVQFSRDLELVQFEWHLFTNHPKGIHIPLWVRRRPFDTGLVTAVPVNVGGVYVIFKNDAPLYVGCSANDLRGRLHSHLTGHGNRLIGDAVRSGERLEYTIAPTLSLRSAEAQLVAEVGPNGSLVHLQARVDAVDKCR